jgi:hypothetical protein
MSELFDPTVNPPQSAAAQGNPGVGNEPVTPPVAMYEGIAEPDLNKALFAATNGAVTNYTEVQELIQAKNQAVELQARLQGLEQNRFANPLIEKLNELAANGAKADDFATYVRLSHLDLNTLNHADAIRMKLQFDPAAYTPAQIDAIMEDDYGLAPGSDFESLSPSSQAKLQRARHEAIQDLQTRKVSYEPKAPVVDPNAELVKQQIVQEQAQTIAQLPAVVPFKMPANPTNGMPEYQFDYTAPNDVVAQVKATVLEQVKANPTAYPATPQGKAASQNLYNFLLANATQEDRMQKMAADIYAAMAQSVRAKEVGPIPGIPGANAIKNANDQGTKKGGLPSLFPMK